MSERTRYFRPAELPGVEALHASFVAHAYRPHSHPTWTIAVVERGAARFELDDTNQRAGRGELFVLEPEAVHTGMAAVPEGWAYKVLYLDPGVLGAYAERDSAPPRAARWVVFEDRALRERLLRAHAALAADAKGLALEEAVVHAVDGLRPHLRPGPPERRRRRAEHAAVRRARAHLRERFDSAVPLAELAASAGSAASSSCAASTPRPASRRMRSRPTCGSRGPAGCSPAASPSPPLPPTAGSPTSRI